MDADYGRNLDHDGPPTRAFEPSLFVWATVMSRPAKDRAIADAGLKALAFDSGPPLACDEPAATYERASDEHGRLAVSAATNRLGVGDKIRLIPATAEAGAAASRARKRAPFGRTRQELRGRISFSPPTSLSDGSVSWLRAKKGDFARRTRGIGSFALAILLSRV
jgi:hypothetical protein